QHNARPGAEGAAAGLYPRRPDRAGSVGRAILARDVVHIPDVAADPELAPVISQGVGAGSLLGVPMLHEGQPIGAIGVSAPHAGPFPPDQIDLLKVFAAQAVIAIENVRLFTELEKRNAALTQSLDRQMATADILRAISGSRTDVQPVFDSIAPNAVQLCGGLLGTVFRFDGELLHMVAHHKASPHGLAELQRLYPSPALRGLVAGRAILDAAVVHVADIELDQTDWLPEQRHVARVVGWRSALIAPMLREGIPIGVITAARAAPGHFSDGEIELLRTFADQAVIAIQNGRLLGELEARTSELTRSVEQLTALGEVGRAVSSSLDPETVLTTIVSRAVELSGLDGGSIFEYDEARGDFERRASINADDALVQAQRAV